MALIQNIYNDYYQSVSAGEVSGQKNVFLIGYNTDIDTAADEDIWFGNGSNTFVEPTAARIHDIVSSSANDTAAGTGAITVLIEGLNSSYIETSETVTLNGLTPVATVNQYVFINRMVVSTVGTINSNNQGNILATAQVDGTLSCAIPAGDGRSSNAFYMVPSGKSAFFTQIIASMFNSNANVNTTIRFWTKPFITAPTLAPLVVASEINLSSTGGANTIILLKSPPRLAEKTIIKARASVNTDNTRVGITMLLTLIDN